MLKRLAIVGCFTWLLVGWPSMAEEHSSATHAGQDHSKNNKASPPITLTLNPVMPPPCTDQHPCYIKQDSAEDLTPKWRRPEWVIVYVTIAYSAITFFMWLAMREQAKGAKTSSDDASLKAQATLDALRRQSDLMKRQNVIDLANAKSTRTSAEAALLNARAVINAERPWVIVRVNSVVGPMGGFTVNVRNKGRSPALITEATMGCAVVSDVATLPKEPPYTWGGLTRNKILIPGSGAQLTWFDTSLFKKILKDDIPQYPWEGRVWVFGKIAYRDLASPDSGVVHETRWIGFYEPPVGDEGNSIFRVEGIGVAPEYDQYT
ncbi:MAG: hypothetical protein WBE38_13150 [Terracidiphilus sp.]